MSKSGKLSGSMMAVLLAPIDLKKNILENYLR